MGTKTEELGTRNFSFRIDAIGAKVMLAKPRLENIRF
jgi:hypothetical protein